MQTAAGLAAAHAQGLVHRDVKPANILLENGVERVRLTDFGLARAVADAGLTQSGVVAGTPHYMAPEQARGEAIDHRADLFSLGSTLYAMCTGHPPFRAEISAGRRSAGSATTSRGRSARSTPSSRLAGGDRRPAEGQGPVPPIPDAPTEVAELLGRVPGPCPAASCLTAARRTGRDDAWTGRRFRGGIATVGTVALAIVALAFFRRDPGAKRFRDGSPCINLPAAEGKRDGRNAASPHRRDRPGTAGSLGDGRRD